MSDSSPPNVTPSSQSESLTSAQSASTKDSPETQKIQNRDDLLLNARSFLNSPQIAQQDVDQKRTFLAGKGLNDNEIDSLLRDLPTQLPLIPPRSYPRPPQSNLLYYLLGFSRLLSWITGGTAILFFIYYRFLLPRVIRTTMARRALRSHHLSLLRRLNLSLESLKDVQTDTFGVLPKPDPNNEPLRFSTCNSIADILELIGDVVHIPDVPSITVLRCGLADFAKDKEKQSVNPNSAELFQFLEDRIPWLTTTEGIQYQQKLLEALSNMAVFRKVLSDETDTEDERYARWSFVPVSPPEASPLVKSLDAMAEALPKQVGTKQRPYQHALQTLSDLTGYLSTQIYTHYRTSSNLNGYFNTKSSLGPVEEEFRNEVKALKGLVLNRRSFMQAVPSPPLPDA